MRKIRLLSPPCRPRHSVEEPSIARTHRPGASPAPAASGRCLELGRSVGGHAPPGGSRQQSACGCALRDAASCGLAVTLPWPMPRCCWRCWAAQISCVVSCASPGGLATGHTYRQASRLARVSTEHRCLRRPHLPSAKSLRPYQRSRVSNAACPHQKCDHLGTQLASTAKE